MSFFILIVIKRIGILLWRFNFKVSRESLLIVSSCLSLQDIAGPGDYVNVHCLAPAAVKEGQRIPAQWDNQL